MLRNALLGLMVTIVSSPAGAQLAVTNVDLLKSILRVDGVEVRRPAQRVLAGDAGALEMLQQAGQSLGTFRMPGCHFMRDTRSVGVYVHLIGFLDQRLCLGEYQIGDDQARS